MPTRERVIEFIDAVVSGDHVQVIADYYHKDAVMQENLNPPRTGRDFLMKHEGDALSRLQSMHTLPPRAFWVEGDKVCIQWSFIATDKRGERRRLDEVSVQLWRGEQITEERFYYDSASAWRLT